MPFIPALSPRTTLIIGVLGIILTAWGGYHLGEPLIHDAPPPPPTHQTAHSHHALPARQTATPSDLSSDFSQPEAPLASNRSRGAPGSTMQTDSQADAETFPPRPSPSPAPSRPRHPTAITPTWPLVLKAVDYQTPGLPPMLQTTVQQLQNQFVQEVGGLNQDPADPEYAKRWLSAAQRADDILRSQIGWESFNAYSLATSGAPSPPQ